MKYAVEMGLGTKFRKDRFNLSEFDRVAFTETQTARTSRKSPFLQLACFKIRKVD
jgi:hypothetical protein